MTDWRPFFGPLSRANPASKFTRDYGDVVLRDVDGSFAPVLGAAMDMVPLPDGHPNTESELAKQYLRENAL